jgi:hypothetical protein
MGAKKVKKGKKGKAKKKGKKGKKEYLPYVYEVPQFIDPKTATPRVEATFKLANPYSNNLDFKLILPITTRIMTIEEHIKSKYERAVTDVIICLHRFRPENSAPPTATLQELGILDSGDIVIYYDFKPVSHPLLS